MVDSTEIKYRQRIASGMEILGLDDKEIDPSGAYFMCAGRR